MLLIFDIDGTLTDTKKIDDDCFIAAFQHEFNIALKNMDWSTFANVTDLGLFTDIYKLAFGIDPPEDKKMNFQRRFFNYLENELQLNNDHFVAVNGAVKFIEHCLCLENCSIAFATGGWSYSAKLKLKAANIFYDTIPLSSCDNFISRRDILLNSIERAKQYYHTPVFARIIYFGDGKWDLTTTQELKIPFVGVDTCNDEKLLKHGAKHVVTDFTDREKIFEIINRLFGEETNPRI